jgi:hypothetical protein
MNGQNTSSSYATIISTDTAHALIDTIITLDENIQKYNRLYNEILNNRSL